MAAAVLLLLGLGFVFNYYAQGVGAKPNLAKTEAAVVKRNNAKKQLLRRYKQAMLLNRSRPKHKVCWPM